MNPKPQAYDFASQLVASKDFFEPKRRTRRNPAVEAVSQNEAANLIIELNKKFELSKAAELIYEIALTVKEQSDNDVDQIPILKILQEVINHPIYESK